MSDGIDYFFTSISPFTWLGQRTLAGIAEKHGKRINYRPFDMKGVWDASGSVPLPERSPTRQRYRLIELQRVAEMRGEKLQTKPSNFPTDPTLADHCIIALQESGEDPGPFFYAVGAALWTHDRQVADEAVITELLEKSGNNSNAILNRAKDDATAAIREANTRAAVDADAIGAPCYVYCGESFWGQDRLEYLDAMISSGRVAYKPE